MSTEEISIYKQIDKNIKDIKNDFNYYLIPSSYLGNNEKFKIAIVFIVSLYVIYNLNLNLNFILIIFLVLLFIFYFSNLNKYDDTQEYKNITNIIDKLDISKKYSYLRINYNVINIYNKLYFIIRFNKTSYRESMKYMNKFYLIYYNIKKGLYKNFKQLDKFKIFIYQKIQNSILYRKKSLNSLKSIICSYPTDNFIINDEKVTNISKYIDDNIKLLDIYSNNNLMELIKINNQLLEDNITVNNNYIYINQPEPNPLNEIDYMPNYNLY